MNWNYISGFFDADGSLSLISPAKNKNKTLYVAFHNNEKHILDSINSFIFEELGFNGSIITKNHSNPNHQTSYELRFAYKKALIVCNNMTIYHRKKKHRIEIYNQIQSLTSPNGKYTVEQLQQREKLCNFFHSIK